MPASNESRGKSGSTGPDPAKAEAAYRRLAPGYDARVRLYEGLRRRAVHRLSPKPGETVVDLGCGTGLSFRLLRDAIGSEGRLLGVELSAEMARLAQERVAEHGWENVTIVEAAAEDARLPARPDALLSVLTHDVMQSPTALQNIVGQLRPRARIAVTGAKWAPRWAFPVNAVVRQRARPYVTTFDGMDRPWSHLERLVADLRVESALLGGAYVAYGTTPG